MAGIASHKHCVVCGNAIDASESFCDELCESKYKSAQRRQQILFGVFIVLMIIIIVLPALISLRGGGT
jgi:predicted nucleic acid-binding Zn ribbon protein